jgi:hypothetical protein
MQEEIGDTFLLPKENILIYQLLFAVEVGLRELIIEAIEEAPGGRGWKQRLPGDVLKAFKEGSRYERSIKWTRLVPHHPLYYTDFPDLKKVLVERNNWDEIFKHVFGRKELLDSTLSELEPIRNKIAHNRKATLEDLHIARAAYSKLSAAVGPQRFLTLVDKCTVAEDLLENLLQLKTEAHTALRDCLASRPTQTNATWAQVQNAWWFDSDYLNVDISPVVEFFATVEEYRQLPRRRGVGHVLEAWVNSKGLTEKYDRAEEVLSGLLQLRGQ